jgi:hypothetical protein
VKQAKAYQKSAVKAFSMTILNTNAAALIFATIYSKTVRNKLGSIPIGENIYQAKRTAEEQKLAHPKGEIGFTDSNQAVVISGLTNLRDLI